VAQEALDLLNLVGFFIQYTGALGLRSVDRLPDYDRLTDLIAAVIEAGEVVSPHCGVPLKGLAEET